MPLNHFLSEMLRFCNQLASMGIKHQSKFIYCLFIVLVDCKSWTWMKRDTEYNKKGECWLRSGYSQGHAQQATASGQVKHSDF